MVEEADESWHDQAKAGHGKAATEVGGHGVFTGVPVLIDNQLFIIVDFTRQGDGEVGDAKEEAHKVARAEHSLRPQ